MHKTKKNRTDKKKNEIDENFEIKKVLLFSISE